MVALGVDRVIEERVDVMSSVTLLGGSIGFFSRTSTVRNESKQEVIMLSGNMFLIKSKNVSTELTRFVDPYRFSFSPL